MGPRTLNKEGTTPTQSKSLPVAFSSVQLAFISFLWLEDIMGGYIPAMTFAPKGLVIRALINPCLD